MYFWTISIALSFIFAGSLLAQSVDTGVKPSAKTQDSRLVFYRTACIKGTLHTERAPGTALQKKASTYVLKTAGPYTVSEAGATKTIQQLYIEAPHKLSLLWYRKGEVEVCGTLLPRGRIAGPTLIVDSIKKVKKPAKKPSG